MTPAKNFVLKEFSEKFHNMESAKNKMLEGDPNLEAYDNSPRHRKNAHSISQVIRQEGRHCPNSFINSFTKNK